jgi:subtilisin family serine protease
MTRFTQLSFVAALFALLFLDAQWTFAQVVSVDMLDRKYLNWFNLDPEKDKALGTSIDKVYTEIVTGKPAGKTVLVAVIDSGVDIDHEDLRDRIWVNEDEIPGNSLDDDNNGYIDDIHGWNFIGNSNGENILYENMEFTRVMRAGGGPDYDKARQLFEKELQIRLEEKKNLEKFEEHFNKSKKIIKEKTGITVTSLKDLDAVTDEDGPEAMNAKRFLASRYEKGFTDQILVRIKQQNADYLTKYLNKDFNPRGLIGDDPLNINDAKYGNPDVKGPRSNHGTSVAGIICAVRGNKLGIDGIATNVKIMCLRSTPNGDERDKDVALAIRYAVDNGADIINMSFGKPLSPQKEFVDQAVRYAEQKDVLIVHGSGNGGENIDETEMYPSDRYLDATEATNWLNVGASSMENDDDVAAIFSNYGKDHVDLFAPGTNIISTDSSSTYSMNDGTSLSAPVVSGVAALLLSYYPDLTSKQLIDILLESSYKIEKKVKVPGQVDKEVKKAKFSSLSKSGGIVNAYGAMKKAESLTKKPN